MHGSFLLKTLYVIRHGDLDNPQKLVYNWDGMKGITLSLSEKGKGQMEEMGRLLKQKGVSVSNIYSSDLLRTKQSAQILARILKVSRIIYTDQLRDSYAPALVGKTLLFLKENYQGNVYTSDFIKNNRHETIAQVANRYLTVFQNILKTNAKDKYYLLVGHGDPIRFLIAKLKNPQKKLTAFDYPLLSQTDYLKKGQAWEIKLNQDNHLVNASILGEQYLNSVRDY